MSKQIQPSVENEQADAGRDGWTRLARPISHARTGTGEYSFSFSTTSRIDNLARLIHNLLPGMFDDHKYKKNAKH